MERYNTLRQGLIDLARIFDETGSRLTTLYVQVIQAPDPSLPPTSAAWNAFIAHNKKTEPWEQWFVTPDSTSMIRFWGGGGQAAIDEYIRLASTAFDLLAGLRVCHGKGETPPETLLEVGRLEPQSDWLLPVGFFGWTALLYEAAVNSPTLLNHATLGNWQMPVIQTWSAEEDDVRRSLLLSEAIEQWSKDIDGERFPLHPTTVTLNHDVFTASVEAIALWTGNQRVTPLVDWHENPSIWLPAPAAITRHRIQNESESEGIARPRWDGELRTLYVGNKIVKVFRQPASNQEAILEAFNEDGWHSHIDDPLPGSGDIEPKKRLRETVESLNKHHRMPGLIWFESDGTGEGVNWHPGPKPSTVSGGEI